MTEDRRPADDGFSTFGLDPALLTVLTALGYEEPTAVQREAIPPQLAGRDLLAEAPTGTGKTAAFALPTLHRIRDRIGRSRSGHTAALVLVPTRELAMQVAEAIHTYGREVGVRVVPVYGGQPIGHQLRQLERGVDVVVATPGRAVDHLDRGTLSFDDVQTVILDEADEMLDMGFAEELEAILSATPAERQTALFSATISPTIARIAGRHMRDPVRITVRGERRQPDGIAAVRQVAYVVRRADKLPALCRILDLEDPTSTLIFARTRGEVDELAQALDGRGRDAGALHGGMSQELRDRVMGRFRDGSLELLVATDVAARGLDIEHVSHVVNFDVPSHPDQYVHRIGRTGRAGRSGVAISLVEPREHRQLRDIEAATKTRLEIARLPTAADLRARRSEILEANLREALVENGFDRFRPVVEALAEEFDVLDIATAAVSLVPGADLAAEEEKDLAPATLPPDTRGRRLGPGARVAFGPGPRGSDGGRSPAPRTAGRHPSAGWARLWIGGGRRAGIRPGDLVGAITHEAGVGGSAVGAIQIADGFSLVDVDEAHAEEVLRVLRTATIRGRRLSVRRDGHSA